MSTDTTGRDAARAAPTQKIYASFALDDEEYAVDVRHVREVVNLPPHIIPMPMSPDFVAGVFNLRGDIIPVLDAKRLLHTGQQLQSPGSKVVVVERGGVRLGLIIDTTGRVLRPRGEQQTLFEYEDRSTLRVVAGVLKLGDDLVRVLDLERLIALENVPHPQDGPGAGSASRAKLQRKRCILFRVGGMQLGFAIGGIHEIVLATNIERSPIQESLCAGVMHIRNQVVPVVRFATLLQIETETDPDIATMRVIVLQLGRIHVGLLVDAVESIESYADEDLMRVPVLTRHKAALFAGCLDFGERGHVFLLNSQSVLDNDEIGRITGNHSDLFGAGEQGAAATHRRIEQRQPYLWFRAREAFALPMQAVREIIEYSACPIATPGAPAFIAGMVNVRGRLLPVVDVRAFYRLGDEASHALLDRKIVVLDNGDNLLGLLVDSVESIARVAPGDKMPLPALLRNSLPPAVRNDVLAIIQAPDQGERPVHIQELDPARIFASIAAQDFELADA